MRIKISNAERTNQILNNYMSNGRVLLDRFNIGDQPVDGVKNRLLRDRRQNPKKEDFEKGGDLEGLGHWLYKVPSKDPDMRKDGWFTPQYTDHFEDIPKEYQESAQILTDPEKLKAKYGEKATNAYNGIRNKMAIKSSGISDAVIRKAFDRFIDGEVDLVNIYLDSDSKDLSDKRDEIIGLVREQYEKDFSNGEYLNYADAYIDRLPGGKTAEKAKKAAMKSRDDEKREKTGLSSEIISRSMPGSVHSPISNNSGIILIGFTKGKNIGKVLHEKQNDICIEAGEMLGADEKDTRIYIGKEVVDDYSSRIPILYTGFYEGEDDMHVSGMIKTTIENTLINSGNNIMYNDFIFDNRTFRPTVSQVENAKDHYSTASGTWRGKIDKPISLNGEAEQIQPEGTINWSVENKEPAVLNEGLVSNEPSGPDEGLKF